MGSSQVDAGTSTQRPDFARVKLCDDVASEEARIGVLRDACNRIGKFASALNQGIQACVNQDVRTELGRRLDAILNTVNTHQSALPGNEVAQLKAGCATMDINQLRSRTVAAQSARARTEQAILGGQTFAGDAATYKRNVILYVDTWMQTGVVQPNRGLVGTVVHLRINVRACRADR
jgi:hypothetical protein